MGPFNETESTEAIEVENSTSSNYNNNHNDSTPEINNNNNNIDNHGDVIDLLDDSDDDNNNNNNVVVYDDDDDDSVEIIDAPSTFNPSKRRRSAFDVQARNTNGDGLGVATSSSPFSSAARPAFISIENDSPIVPVAAAAAASGRNYFEIIDSSDDDNDDELLLSPSLAKKPKFKSSDKLDREISSLTAVARAATNFLDNGNDDSGSLALSQLGSSAATSMDKLKSSLSQTFPFMDPTLEGAIVKPSFREYLISYISAMNAGGDINDFTEPINIHIGKCRMVVFRYTHLGATIEGGDFVTLVRDQSYTYGLYTVRVENSKGEVIGYLEKEMGPVLVPLMNHSSIIVDAKISPGNFEGGMFPITVDIDAKITSLARANDEVGSAISFVRMYFAQKNVTFEPSAVVSNHFQMPQGIGHGTERMYPTVQSREIEWEAQAQQLDEMFDKQTKDQLKNLPNLPMPCQLFHPDKLFDYQQDGVKWLVKRENSKKLTVPFYKETYYGGSKVWRCTITKTTRAEAPKPIRGSILADEMGLGKTIQTIALILASPPGGVEDIDNLKPVKKEEPPKKTEEKEVKKQSPTKRLKVTREMIRRSSTETLIRMLKVAHVFTSGPKERLVTRCLVAVDSGGIPRKKYPVEWTVDPSTPLPDNKSEKAALVATAKPETDATRIKPTQPSLPSSPGVATPQSLLMKPPPRHPTCTLIVCPLSVMSNWEQQISQFVKPGVLRVGTYHGKSRHSMVPIVRRGLIDVLLVSYHTLAHDLKNYQSRDLDPEELRNSKISYKRQKLDSLFDVRFHRIVLDEAHTIRNDKSGFFKAVMEIKANLKLALTGTPFVNRPDDVYSLLAFLEVSPLSDKIVYRHAITIPMEQGKDLGLSRLRTVMAHVTLRRSKALAGIKLSEKTVQLRSVDFSDGVHKDTYEALFGTFRIAFRALMSGGEEHALKNYSYVLEKLLRLRQACCSAMLIQPDRRERTMEIWKSMQQQGDEKINAMTAEEGIELMEKLEGVFKANEDKIPECSVCLEELSEDACVVLRGCGHVYCEPCLEKVKPRICPLCRKGFTKDDILTRDALANVAAEATKKEGDNDSESSTKKAAESTLEEIQQPPKVLALLAAINEMQPDEKGVIFSQFTTFLDIIGKALKNAGHSFTRLDGSMNPAQRISACKAFQSDVPHSPRFIICSLHAAGTGINLTRGNHSFMMDCWWNMAVENQAMDRIHRIGQARSVRIVKLVMKDSIEERIVKMQESKHLNSEGVSRKLTADEKRRARLSNLRGLLLLDDPDDLEID